MSHKFFSQIKQMNQYAKTLTSDKVTLLGHCSTVTYGNPEKQLEKNYSCVTSFPTFIMEKRRTLSAWR